MVPGRREVPTTAMDRGRKKMSRELGIHANYPNRNGVSMARSGAPGAPPPVSGRLAGPGPGPHPEADRTPTPLHRGLMGDTPSDREAPERRPGTPPPARETRPTPVRDALSESASSGADVPLPGRDFSLDGQAWWAQELGRTRTGRREDPGADLILVGFRPADSPPDVFVREALVQGASLDGLSEEGLTGLAAAAGPFRPLADLPRPFFGPPAPEGSEGRPPPRGRAPGRRGRR